MTPGTAGPVGGGGGREAGPTRCPSRGGVRPVRVHVVQPARRLRAVRASSSSTATTTTCVSRVELGCTRDLEVPDSNQTTGGMAACARDANNASCDDLLANVFPTSCQIKPGTRLNGEGCGSSWQCMSTHCEKTDGDCGVCAPRAAAERRVHRRREAACRAWCARRRSASTPARDGRAVQRDGARAARTSIAARSATSARRRWRWAHRAGATPSACDFRQGVVVQLLRAATQKCETVAAAPGRPGVRHRQRHADPLRRRERLPGRDPRAAGARLAPRSDGTQCTDIVALPGARELRRRTVPAAQHELPAPSDAERRGGFASPGASGGFGGPKRAKRATSPDLDDGELAAGADRRRRRRARRGRRR